MDRGILGGRERGREGGKEREGGREGGRERGKIETVRARGEWIVLSPAAEMHHQTSPPTPGSADRAAEKSQIKAL